MISICLLLNDKAFSKYAPFTCSPLSILDPQWPGKPNRFAIASYDFTLNVALLHLRGAASRFTSKTLLWFQVSREDDLGVLIACILPATIAVKEKKIHSKTEIRLKQKVFLVLLNPLNHPCVIKSSSERVYTLPHLPTALRYC